MIVYIGADLDVDIVVGAGAVPHLDLHLLDGLVVVFLIMINNMYKYNRQSSLHEDDTHLHLTLVGLSGVGAALRGGVAEMEASAAKTRTRYS